MRIASNTTTELVLEHRPIVLPALGAALCAAVVFQTLQSAASLSASEWAGASAGILVGGFITYLMALPSRVVFDSSRREIRLRHSGWPGRGENRCAFDDVTGVEVQEDSSIGAKRVVLLTSRGPIPLTRHFSGIEPHRKTASTIQKWLRGHGCELLGDGPNEHGAIDGA